QVSFNPRAAWTYPDSLMGVISYIKQGFLDAQQNAAALAIYNQNPAGNKRPDQSASADALAAVVRRDVPVVFVADSELMMRRAMTLRPARIFGIDRQLGSLEKGKIANIVISDKPIFDEKVKVTHVLVDGRETKLGTPPSGGGGASPLDGTWRITVKSSTGDV